MRADANEDKHSTGNKVNDINEKFNLNRTRGNGV